jgi:GT2 family glycosyltransferase
MSKSRISVIIPTKGRPAVLIKALSSVATQTMPVEEVIVVDGTAQPADAGALTGALADAPNPPRLVYCWAPSDMGLTAARNRGVQASSGDIIQFLDDDTTVAPDYFEHVTQTFDSAEIGGVTGQMIDSVATARALRGLLFRCFYVGPFRQRKDELFLRPPATMTLTNTLPGACAYRRSVFDEFRFDEGLTGPGIGEDLEFSYRVGRKWKLAIQPRALIFHHRSADERPTSRRIFADKICFYHYHFRKNMRGNAIEWLTYAWLNVGFAVDAAVRLRSEPVLGVTDGWRRIAQRGLRSRPPRSG